jgi:hypothetical protein
MVKAKNFMKKKARKKEEEKSYIQLAPVSPSKIITVIHISENLHSN